MNRRIPLRIAGLLGVALALASAGFAASAQTEDPVRFEIPPQPLSDALILFGDQSGQGVMADSVATETLDSPGYTGEAVPETALRQLLEGTGLTYRQDGDVFVILSPASSSVAGQNQIGQRQPGIEEIIVTGQKREERIQDVPIAISAFSPEDLEAQKIEGGFDLLKGVPNVTFSKTNFSGYNFQIRGIGTQAVSATTDPGVAVSFNNTTLIVNRLFEQEYLDVERVEVLRGPQGTLFGRNATAGVINVISNKPELGVWDGMIDVEVGNHNTRRLRGFFNAPIGDTIAIRGAYASTKRDGYGINEAADDPFSGVKRDVDDRDLWTGRFTIGWQPNDRLRVNLLWERFEEDDRRVRTSKQLCHRDESLGEAGFETLDFEFLGAEGSTPLPQFGDIAGVNVLAAGYSQGCKPGSLYDDEAFGTVNGASLPFISGIFWSQEFGDLSSFVDAGRTTEIGFINGPNPFHQNHSNDDDGFIPGLEPAANAPCPEFATSRKFYSIDVCQPDPYGGADRRQSRDLRTISSLIEPRYRASADIVELSLDYEVTDDLLLSSQTVYVDDEYFATQDYNRYATVPIWSDATNACGYAVVSGKQEIDCSDDPDTGRGTFLSDLPKSPYSSDPSQKGYYAALLGEGVVCDPQLGCSDKLIAQDLSRATATQYNQELRLVSSYAGDWNFSLGANYTRFRTVNDYFVFSNAFSHLLHYWPFNAPTMDPHPDGTGCPAGTENPEPEQKLCRYIDPNPIDSLDGDGHNYFRSANPYKLTSQAVFGELYWNATDTVKATLGLRMTWDRKVFTPVPSQLLLADYRDIPGVRPGDPPPTPDICFAPHCPLSGTAHDGRGSPSEPDIVQSWREPTGRLVVDWQPVLDFTDETMVYASFAHGYKGGGANPPGVAPPSGLVLARASGAAAPPTFEPEFVNAYEVGTKNTLFGGALVLNGTAFYYDYSDYQVSKIADRQAVNENFDAQIWGAELETVFAPSLNWQFNAAIGYLNTEIADGEKSIDLMDRTQGGNRRFDLPEPIKVPNPNFDPATDPPEEEFDVITHFDDWSVVKPWVTAASNCIAPTMLLAADLQERIEFGTFRGSFTLCPGSAIVGGSGGGISLNYFDRNGDLVVGSGEDFVYDVRVHAPNGGAGFFADLSGNELPNAPHLTIALGGQYNFDLTRNWRATARVDYYWQDESYARVYNTEYDRLKSWSNTNLSFWITNSVNGITVEGYVKNVFDETPITGTFLNSDDSGLTTNVFTLDPRLIGVSIRKEF